MRLLFYTILTSFCMVKLHAQDTIYIKSYSDTLSVSKNEASYFKVIYKKSNPVRIDFFDINGSQISTEHFSLTDFSIRNGESIYFNDGKVSMKGSFLNNKMNGAWITYANDGKQIQKQEEYLDGSKNGKSIVYSSNGKKEKEEEYLNGAKNGNSTVFFSNGKPRKVYIYLYDRITKSTCYDSLANKLDCDSLYLVSYPQDTSGMIYDRAEVMPQFPGGVAELMKFLSVNINYPSLARKNGLEGKVILKFVVNEKGLLTDITILNDGVGGGCAEESIRVCKLMPRWMPALQNNKFVKAYYTLPVSYKLQ